MKIKIHEIATKEFDEAINWYDNQAHGLGKRFRESVIAQINKIKKNPTWFSMEADGIYKAYIPNFHIKYYLP
jgi:hypothetical protein